MTPAPLVIGPHRVWPPVVLAPMAGVTNAAFRQLCRQYGAGLYVSEMITARAVAERNPKTFTMVARAPGEATHSVQIYGTDPATIERAVAILVGEVGVEHVDMNFGCPAPKVTRRGGGAALTAHPSRIGALVAAAVRSAGAVPVTVKFRMGVDDHHVTHLEVGRVAADAGACAIALHARTAEQRYSGHARWDAIAALKATVVDVPVLGNGDIWSAGDALAMVRATGCDGVVVGRGCLGRPWLFADLAAAFGRGADDTCQPAPTLGEVVAVLECHASLLAEWFGEAHGLRELRKHVAWYLKGYAVGAERRARLALVSSLDELARLLAPDEIDRTQRPDPLAVHSPRGHTDGPRPVALPAGWLDGPAPLPLEDPVVVSGG